MTKTTYEMFETVKAGTVTLAEFIEWVYDKESDAYSKGNYEGYNEGFESSRGLFDN